MLQTQDISYQYSQDVNLRFPDLHFGEKEQWLILGQSGSGKTTLLHLLAGLLKPKSGKIQWGTQALNQISDKKLDQLRGQKVGMVFQKSHFIQALNVEDNLRTAQFLAGKAQDKKQIAALLERLNLEGKAKRKPSRLSQGEQQRVAIARALINQPQIILADEPTSSLDNKNTDTVASLLRENALAFGATLVIVTHDERLKQAFTNTIAL